jgi:hypothetical protein
MKPTRHFSNKQEKSISKDLQGKPQINSGATPFYKGDVKTEHFLIEAKTTTTPKSSFAIKKEWLVKINNEAFASGSKLPVLAFRFEPDGEDYYVLTKRGINTLKTLLDVVRAMEADKDGE